MIQYAAPSMRMTAATEYWMPRWSLSSGSPKARPVARHDEGKMTSPDLPAELKAALDAKLKGLSRNDAAERSAAISKTYRDGGGSGAIRSETDALAYALARMPATYAAVTASLNALLRNPPGLCAENACSMSAPGRARRAGRRPKRFPRCKPSRCSMPTTRLRTLALDLAQRQLAPARGRLRARRGPRTRSPRRRRPTSSWRAT